MINPERQLPIGEASKLENEKEVLPALEVKNHVLWINPEFPESPFSLEEGASANLARFFTPITEKTEEEPRFKVLGREFGKKVSTSKLETHDMEVEIFHSRSAILGRVIFKDKEGRLYRDVDLKGVGRTYKKDSGEGFIVADVEQQRDSKESWGILDLTAAYYDKEISEIFLDLGIRAHRTVAIISLEEIVDKNGEKLSIDEARKNGLISEHNKPAIQIRAFGTKIRLGDLVSNEKSKNELYVEDARKMVASELGKRNEDFDKFEYLRWLAQTTAKNIGIMHRNGWYHGFLMSGYNLTLDGRITDFDSVSRIKEGEKKQPKSDDFTKALDSFKMFVSYLEISEDRKKELFGLFSKTYTETAEGVS